MVLVAGCLGDPVVEPVPPVAEPVPPAPQYQPVEETDIAEESTPPLEDDEEEDYVEVEVPFTQTLGLFEEEVPWKGFINTQPITEPE